MSYSSNLDPCEHYRSDQQNNADSAVETLRESGYKYGVI